MMFRLVFSAVMLLGVFSSHVAAQEVPPYDRKEYGGWIDANGNGLDTRREVLSSESTVSLASLWSGKVIELWSCPFTDFVSFEAKHFDIDHLVPLREAHISGGWRWPKEKKVEYANFLGDSDHLVAVKAGANRSKGARDPALWMPEENRCAYAIAWTRVKHRWGLEFDRAEVSALLRAIADCPAQY